MSELIHLKNFIQSTRDSGYKNVAFAIAEIIDNALEAAATVIEVNISRDNDNGAPKFNLSASDNGTGMPPRVLRLALQFGGTTRYNSRKSFGRYGMGLPNSSMSQCRRLEVYSWRKPNVVNWNYLDIDEVVAGSYVDIPPSKRKPLPKQFRLKYKSGTVIIWKKIDRLGFKLLKPLEKKLHLELGKVYRKPLLSGKRIRINNKSLEAFDPLYLDVNPYFGKAKQYGSPMLLKIRKDKKYSTVKVKFSELPLDKWSPLKNIEKRRMGITKNAGVSVLRNGREIDYGWFFMGAKRKENYDDWWRCEVSFDPELDEYFGVTHTKQTINPNDILNSILRPHIEAAAHKLHNRVREKFIVYNEKNRKPEAVKIAEINDYLINPPDQCMDQQINYNIGRSGKFNGLKYNIRTDALRTSALFDIKPSKAKIDITINDNHPYYKSFLSKIDDNKTSLSETSFNLFVLALARAEVMMEGPKLENYRVKWGNILKRFLA